MRRKKTRFITACIVLILVVSVVGTIAYLIDTTGPVNNTFTVGKLLDDPSEFVLKEHEATDSDKDGVYTLDEDKEVVSNTYTVLPGVDLPKDPFVKTNEELKMDAYVFIEVVDGTGTALRFIVDSAKWTDLPDVTGPNEGKVYVMAANGGIVEADAALGPITILKKNDNGKEITVDNVAITDEVEQFGGNVTFYGYMIQAGGFADYNAAWAGFGQGGN